MKIKPFTFDSFDQEITHIGDNGTLPDEIADEEQAEEILPTFSEDELESAKQQAYDDGFIAGKKEGLREIDRESQGKQNALSLVTASIENNLDNMRQDYQNTLHKRQKELGKIVIACADKLAAEALRKDPISDISHMIESSLDVLFDAPELIANVHPDIAPLLQEKLPNIVTVQADESLQLNDCNLNWQHGQAMRDSAQLWQEVDTIIERHFKTSSKQEFSSEQRINEPTEIEMTEGVVAQANIEQANTEITEINNNDGENNE